MQTDPLLMTLAELNLSVRATNCLESEGIRSVAQLVRLTPERLLQVRNFGQTTLDEVEKRLDEIGLRLGDGGAPPGFIVVQTADGPGIVRAAAIDSAVPVYVQTDPGDIPHRPQTFALGTAITFGAADVIARDRPAAVFAAIAEALKTQGIS